jgi:hypothetical protein
VFATKGQPTVFVAIACTTKPSGHRGFRRVSEVAELVTMCNHELSPSATYS